MSRLVGESFDISTPSSPQSKDCVYCSRSWWSPWAPVTGCSTAGVDTAPANLMREELTPSERDDLRRRRQELCQTLPLKTTHGNGAAQGHGKETQEESSAPAADTLSKTESAPSTIQQQLPVDINNHDGEGSGRGRSTNLAPLGSKAPQAFIPTDHEAFW